MYNLLQFFNKWLANNDMLNNLLGKHTVYEDIK